MAKGKKGDYSLNKASMIPKGEEKSLNKPSMIGGSTDKPSLVDQPGKKK